MSLKNRLSHIRQSYTLKLFAVGFLILCFLVPLKMVRGVIHERTYHKEQAVQSIAASWANSQKVFGPVIVRPYKEYRTVEWMDPKTQQKTQKTDVRQKYDYVLPTALDVKADVQIQERYRGIYKVPVYTAALNLSGHFDDLNEAFRVEEGVRVEKQTPYLVLGIQDVRGLAGDLKIKWGDKALAMKPGTGLKNFGQGVHVPLDISDNQARGTFSANLSVKGIKSLHFVPVGQSTKLAMTSPWQHPSFEGQFLPSERVIDETGFEASWETGALATNIEQYFSDCARRNSCHEFWGKGFGVKFYQSVDIYQQAQRSVKYGILFMTITFGAFFIFEVMKQMRVHPIQYTMVGGALAVFYLLLVSLSEHLAFAAAYFLAATAVTGLLGYYVAHVLGHAGRGALFGGLIGGLYAVLYCILQSEDYALLMGSSMMFIVLAVVMIMTRKVNWYGAGES